MKGYGEIFKDKKITLMGLGLLGRGVGDATFLARCGADLTVTDLKTAEQLATSLEQLKDFKNIKFVLGEHRLEDFRPENADIVMKAAGVPLDSPFILEAQKNNVPIVMSTSLFAEFTEAKFIGVTGTRGKSTVAYLLNDILKEHSKSQKSGRVFLGGNIRGVATLELLNETRLGDIAVLELDSWLLQGFGNTHNWAVPKNTEEFHGFSPSVSVFTTFMPDHMNYYNNDLERYFADKANIYRFQSPEDVLLVSEQVMDYIKKFGPKPRAKVVVAKVSDVPDSWKLRIPGEHNKLNVALAVAAAKAMGVPERTIEKAVESFKAAPGRLEHIRTYKGIEIYNDTNGTTPEATTVALEAFGKDKKTVLIFGGADKKLSPDKLLEILPEYIKVGVVLPGTGTELMREKLTELSQKIPITFVENMPDAVKEALKMAEKGDRIIMSPAFASFGLFKNEYDRGDQFNEAVSALK